MWLKKLEFSPRSPRHPQRRLRFGRDTLDPGHPHGGGAKAARAEEPAAHVDGADTLMFAHRMDVGTTCW